MAGIFRFSDNTKPEPGIPNDVLKKRPFILFFELAWRNLGRLILFNLLFFLILLPIIAVVYNLSYSYLFGALSQMEVDLTEFSLSFLSSIILNVVNVLPPWTCYALMTISVILYGPSSCGMAFIMRNLVQQRHVWNSDFIDRFKQNFRQGLVLGIIDLAIMYALIFNITGNSGEDISGILSALRIISFVIMPIYMFLRNYVFVMCVTFNLNVFQILRNAFAFAFLGFWRNLLVLAVNAILFLAVFYFGSVIEFVAVPFLIFSITSFISMFICFPVMKKYLLDPLGEE